MVSGTGQALKVIFFVFLLCVSLLFSSIYYKNYELIDNQGQINARVVVGSRAHVSDVVAATKIAQFLIQNSYQSSKLSAVLSTQPKINCNVSAVPEIGTCACLQKSAVVELTRQSPKNTFFSVKLDDYLDNNTGNRVLDNKLEHLMQTQFFEQGFKIDKTRLGVLNNEELLIAGTKYIQNNKIFLIGHALNSSAFHPIFFAYKVEFKKAANFYSGIEKCFVNFQQDDYYAYCSVTNDPESFIGNKRSMIKLFGQSYVILDMAVPFVSNLTSYDDRVFGGKLALGKGEKYIEASTGTVISVENISYTVYVFPEFVELRPVNSSKANKTVRLWPGYVFNFGKSAVKFWGIESERQRKAKISFFSEYHQLENGKKFNGFKVFILWVNNGPIPRISESSKRPDALRALYLVKDDFDVLEPGTSKEIGTSSGLFISNLGNISDYATVKIEKIAAPIIYTDFNCSSVLENSYYKIYLPSGYEVFYTEKSGKFLVRINDIKHEYYQLNNLFSNPGTSCYLSGITAINSSILKVPGLLQGVVFFSIQNRSLYLGVLQADFESCRTAEKLSNNGTTKLPQTYCLQKLVVSEIIKNNSLNYSNNLDFYGILATKKSENEMTFFIPFQEQEIIISLESGMVFQESKQAVVLPDNSIELFDAGSLLAKSINVETGSCSVKKSDVRCTLDEQSQRLSIIENAKDLNMSMVRTFKKIYAVPEDLVITDVTYGFRNDSNIIIAVGGYAVNLHSKEIPVLNKGERGIFLGKKKIIIAGYSKEDTAAAVEEFLSVLRKQSILLD